MLTIFTEDLQHELVKICILILETEHVYDKLWDPNQVFILMYFVRTHARHWHDTSTTNAM